MPSNELIDVSPNPRIDEVIGDTVHQLMWRARETQTSLAPLLSLGQSALSLKIRGRRPWSALEVDVMARHFGVSPAVLFGFEPIPDGWAPSGSNRRPKD
ncbi:hypothetical protein E3O55_08315 [Cryobacterium sp. MDB1-18-2]|nr:hypothetical protein E3O55_08315 [Cryobacterium sp. MDB1-18-2]TFC41699.1 hypothetical protein E3O50_09755 [Cryobacterium sp. MDB1-18-1]